MGIKQIILVLLTRREVVPSQWMDRDSISAAGYSLGLDRDGRYMQTERYLLILEFVETLATEATSYFDSSVFLSIGRLINTHLTQ